MKTYHRPGNATNASLNGKITPVLVDGKSAWIVGEGAPTAGTLDRVVFDMVIGGEVTKDHPRTFTLGRVDTKHTLLMISDMAGGDVIKLFTSYDAARNEFNAYLERYSTDRRWSKR